MLGGRFLAGCTVISMVGCGELAANDNIDEPTPEAPLVETASGSGEAYTPQVVLAVPESAAYVRPEVVVKLLFSMPMDTEISSAAFSVMAAGGERVAGTLNWDVTGMVSAFRPDQPLAEGVYDARVDPSACNTDGVALALPFTTRFQVYESSGDDKPYAG